MRQSLELDEKTLANDGTAPVFVVVKGQQTDKRFQRPVLDRPF
jgi:hypothetical protein